MPCFIAGKMQCLTNTQLQRYSLAQSTFLRIQAHDTAVSNARTAGNKSLSYYVFKEGEQALYRQGQFLLVQNDPTNVVRYESVVKV